MFLASNKENPFTLIPPPPANFPAPPPAIRMKQKLIFDGNLADNCMAKEKLVAKAVGIGLLSLRFKSHSELCRIQNRTRQPEDLPLLYE